MTRFGGSWREREAILVVLVAIHSYVVGLVLIFASSWSLRLGGWPEGGTLFFTRQGGAFHLIIATVYLYEYFRFGSIFALGLAKAVAVVFLLTLTARGEPWLVPASAVGDGLMLISVVGVRVLRGARGDADPL